MSFKHKFVLIFCYLKKIILFCYQKNFSSWFLFSKTIFRLCCILDSSVYMFIQFMEFLYGAYQNNSPCIFFHSSFLSHPQLDFTNQMLPIPMPFPTLDYFLIFKLIAASSFFRIFNFKKYAASKFEISLGGGGGCPLSICWHFFKVLVYYVFKWWISSYSICALCIAEVIFGTLSMTFTFFSFSQKLWTYCNFWRRGGNFSSWDDSAFSSPSPQLLRSTYADILGKSAMVTPV